MKISRLRLTGFKSFVEPSELVIEPGLTGVVGPNGCGKSNLLEALRWAMGETSTKSMRAPSMDHVIFSGTAHRPARNTAEVTIFLDNSDRQAPAEFNDAEQIEITRRIERDSGSTYLINGREARARDIKILFEDAATGARSPALVRQGQIAEIVNAKPEQRRRVLEDAAGIAGLHSRRHEAELRLKAAETNLARLTDIMGQLDSQVESLKRQARQARRYKDLSTEIQSTEAILCHLVWQDIQAQVDTEERQLSAVFQLLAVATTAESAALNDEVEAVAALKPLREREAELGAAVSRVRIECETLERDAARAEERERELSAQLTQLETDLTRETNLISEAQDILERLAAENSELESAAGEADVMQDHLHTTLEEADASATAAEANLAKLTERAAELRARRTSLQAAEAERAQGVSRLEAKLSALAQDAEDTSRRAPDSLELEDVTVRGQTLAVRVSELEQATLLAEDKTSVAEAELSAARTAAQDAKLAHSALVTERQTLTKLVIPAMQDGQPPVVEALKVSPGYEAAVVAALGDDLDAPVADSAPIRWRHVEIGPDDAALPAEAEPLSLHVGAPHELSRRLRQVGVVDPKQGARLQPLLKPGQRLVSLEGDLWRWDGFVVTAGGTTPAAQRLAERNRLSGVLAAERTAEVQAEKLGAVAQTAAETHQVAEQEQRALRAEWRKTQSELSETREALNGIERAARETEAKLRTIAEARDETERDLVDARALLDQAQDALVALEDDDDPTVLVETAQRDATHLRQALALAQQQLATHDRDQAMRQARREAIQEERARWTSRGESADGQIAALRERREQITSDLNELRTTSGPALVERREELLSTLSDAEAARQAAADRVAEADGAQRAAVGALREAQAAVSSAREEKARGEARLEAVRDRRTEEARRIQELLSVVPQDCLKIAGLEPDADLPTLQDIDRQLQRLKADRERLGGVNLQADDELNVILEQVTAMQSERGDVEQAVNKLRNAIIQLNREGKKRLDEAFETVDRHFRRLFTTLFGGGEARLEMIAGEDPLESGLEIVAKPPGKKPATLSLLSGGEQTLTALSLIFAVFLTNPSPICVLDEVDAPLDDANVDRFCLLMEKMAEETATRFLVITHHPMTMTRMNRLFGVTMAEKGVSQLVSVDLQTAQSFREAS